MGLANGRGSQLRRYLAELRSLADWQARLGKPELHWKRGASALELAVSWSASRSSPRGLPEVVAALLDTEETLEGASLRLAVPELRTPLDDARAPSQTDLWALLCGPKGTVSLAVEAKAKEPFGDTVDSWRSAARGSGSRERRLLFLCDKLGLDPRAVGGLRYQLLHRVVACLIEAENWNADSAVLLVQRFTTEIGVRDASWSDFEAFAAALRAKVRPGTLTKAAVPGGTPLYLGWTDCRVSTDEEIVKTLVGG